MCSRHGIEDGVLNWRNNIRQQIYANTRRLCYLATQRVISTQTSICLYIPIRPSVIRALFIMGKRRIEADSRSGKRSVQGDLGEGRATKRRTSATVC